MRCSSCYSSWRKNIVHRVIRERETLRECEGLEGVHYTHLLGGGDTVTGITFPHQIRFYAENGVPYVQNKHYIKDVWGHAEGHFVLAFCAEKRG